MSAFPLHLRHLRCRSNAQVFCKMFEGGWRFISSMSRCASVPSIKMACKSLGESIIPNDKAVLEIKHLRYQWLRLMSVWKSEVQVYLLDSICIRIKQHQNANRLKKLKFRLSSGMRYRFLTILVLLESARKMSGLDNCVSQLDFNLAIWERTDAKWKERSLWCRSNFTQKENVNFFY